MIVLCFSKLSEINVFHWPWDWWNQKKKISFIHLGLWGCNKWPLHASKPRHQHLCKMTPTACHSAVNMRAGNCRCVMSRAWRQIQPTSPGTHTPAHTQEAEPVILDCIETLPRSSTSANLQERPSLQRTPPKVGSDVQALDLTVLPYVGNTVMWNGKKKKKLLGRCFREGWTTLVVDRWDQARWFYWSGTTFYLCFPELVCWWFSFIRSRTRESDRQ